MSYMEKICYNKNNKKSQKTKEVFTTDCYSISCM